jgi:hypothetical protein
MQQLACIMQTLSISHKEGLFAKLCGFSPTLLCLIFCHTFVAVIFAKFLGLTMCDWNQSRHFCSGKNKLNNICFVTIIFNFGSFLECLALDLKIAREKKMIDN